MLSKEEIEKVKRGLTEELGRTITANECGLSTNDFSESIEILESALKYIEQLETEKANKLIAMTDLYIKSVPKDKIREKIITDKAKLSRCPNSIFKDICRARIEFGQELLEGK